MTAQIKRRSFLKTAGTAAVGLGSSQSFLAISPATAQEAKVTPELVRFSDDVEPLIRLIENTPRDKCAEMLVEQLRRGDSYRQFMAALFLGGLRHFARRLSALHCVYVLHAAHQLSLDARVEHRLLPLFLALDSFKEYQSRRDLYKSPALPLLSGPLPAASNARAEFHAAMQDWDAPRADRALVMLLRVCAV